MIHRTRTTVLALAALVIGACHTAAPGPGQYFACRAPFGSGEVHYVDVGHEAPTLVLVHGLASDTRSWRKLVPLLAERHRLLVVDLPGHGQSDAPQAPHSIPLYADAVASVLDHAGIERAFLVGHSNGAPVVASFAHRHPRRTLGLVVIDGALLSVVPREAAEQMFSNFTEEGWREAMTGMVESMPAPELAPEDRAAILEMALDQFYSAVRGGFEAAVAEDAFQEAPLGVPVLALMTVSPFWNEDYRELANERAPDLEWREFEGAGHYLQMERPADLRDAIEDFVERRGLSR